MQAKKSENIICVASTSWDTNFVQAVVQIVSMLAAENKVLYVDYAFTWIDVIRGILKKGNLRILHILGLKSRIRKIETEYHTQLFILSLPPIFPINWINNIQVFNFLNKLNYNITIRAIVKAQKKLELTNPYLINSWNPIFGINYTNELNQKSHLYYCYDEISASKWIAKHGARLEKLFIPKVDKVITTSKSLADTKGQLNKHCFVVPNGVNISLFNEYLTQKEKAKVIEKNNFKYTIGYIGALDTRIDVEMLLYAVQKLKDYQFVFVGKVSDSKIEVSLSKFKNVYFIGNLPSIELPKYLYEFDVCIIPFVKNDFTANVYPMKINEYLSMGKPVVLTDFNDLPEFESTCSIVTNKEDFALAIENELTLNNDSKYNARIKKAEENSWDKRTDLFLSIMNS